MTREQLLARQQELLNAASAEQRDLTPEEQAQFDECQRQLDAMGAPENNNPNMGQRNLGGDDNGSGARPDDSEAAQRAVAAERQRVAEVTELCRSFGIDATQYVNNGSTIEQTRAAVLEELKRTHAPIGARVTQDEGDKFRAAAADGLAMRSGVAVENAAEGAESFRNMDLRSLGQECLIRSGMDSLRVRSMSSDEVFNELTRQAFNPTSAFPAIMDAAVNKSVVEMYQHAPTTFQLWVTEGSKSDFKETKDHEYVINSVGDFDEVPENGELKNSKIDTELLPSSKLKTYGKQFTMTRQAFINDDIGLVTRMPGLYAVKAKKTIDKLVYKTIFDNKKIFDGKTLFHADHNNVIAQGTAPSVASLQKMILTMQLQKDQFGEPIYVTPRHIVVPVGYGFDLYTILHSAQTPGTNNNDKNALANLSYPLDVIESPQLNAMAGANAIPWFMVADPLSAPSVGVDYLNGKKTPTVRRMEAAGTLGFVWDVYIDAGIWVRDFRGIVKNPGVALSI